MSPPDPPAALVERGQAAIRRGDGAAARTAFEAAVEAEPTGEALEGLARALYLEVDYKGSMALHERAYAAYREAGDHQGAARAARMLAWLHGALYGDWAVGNGWLGRAQRFLEEAGRGSGEHGWVELTRAMSEPDATRREQHLRAALAIGRRVGDADLEFEALGWVGMELVGRGEVEEGMRLLDEALTAVCAGEVDDLYVVEGTFCSMFTACERSHDVVRAEQWIRRADEVSRGRSLVAVGAYCRAHYGGILTAAGRWEQAEAELTAALGVFERGHPAMSERVLVRLAHLRLKQGRLDEAARLLDGLDHHPDAVVVLAELRLARGELALAADGLERALTAEPDDATVAGPLLALLADVRLARREHPSARAAADRLDELAGRAASPYLRTRAALTAGKVGMAAADPTARARLVEAVERLAGLQMPLELAQARLELARADAAARPEVSAAEARAALATFLRLGAGRDADAALALLRSLGVAAPARARVGGPLTRRETEVLDLLGHGYSNAEVAGRLFISPKTVEHHVGRILAKLGLRNRAEAAAHAVSTRARDQGGK